MTIVFVAVLETFGLLCSSGPDGSLGPKHRH
jgi:hypothetical protein